MWRRCNLSEYEIIDYLLINFIEPGDLINFAGEDFRVLEIEPSDDGWILEVLDRMEDQIDLFIPDDSVIALLSEGMEVTEQ
jgi:hypothetical protein